MNNELKVVNLYNNENNNRIDSFNKNIQSNFSIETNYEKNEVSFEWLDMMEDTVRYLDNIMRNPNRFIVNEEEIVKIEQAKRITVESIKHLSKHTNFIQEIEKNGDVRPSKILNINKDESFNTYENRVIYTLIQNMRSFIDIKKKNLITSSSMKDNKKCSYNAVTRVGAENVNINLTMDAKLVNKEGNGISDGQTVEQRIEKLELQITDLTNSAVYKSLAKLHVARVIPPIKKTNLILKNVNFQYAMKLWDYLQRHTADEDKCVKNKKVYKDDNDLKQMLDDVFLLNYLVVNSVSLNKDTIKAPQNEKVVEELTNNMINKIVEINSDLPLEKLQNIIGDKIAVVKNKREASIEEVQQKFNNRIQSYLNKVESFKF
jgi:DNA repair protein SbcC/Rad50